jgi:YrbI family 3-deoxy-D-manno-octulosonate 8-phosphate phosphatase|tara:strand:+ start:506 stop:1003 length:498 start_codon:yes stop_codon:yes gene_type:complete
VNAILEKKDLQSIKLVGFDFDGVFTDNMVYVQDDGSESVRCWRSDGLGLAKLKSLGIEICIISTEINPVVTMRAQKLDIPCLQNIENKADAISSLSKKLNIDLEDTMFVGNDINDIAAFKAVGIAIGVADSHDSINPFIAYKLKTSGGLGAVREICDLIFNAHND